MDWRVARGAPNLMHSVIQSSNTEYCAKVESEEEGNGGKKISSCPIAGYGLSEWRERFPNLLFSFFLFFFPREMLLKLLILKPLL